MDNIFLDLNVVQAQHTMRMKHMDLQAARKERGLKQTEVADLAGLDKATVSRIEAGEITNPSNATVAKLEVALKLRRGTLVFGNQATEIAS